MQNRRSLNAFLRRLWRAQNWKNDIIRRVETIPRATFKKRNYLDGRAVRRIFTVRTIFWRWQVENFNGHPSCAVLCCRSLGVSESLRQGKKLRLSEVVEVLFGLIYPFLWFISRKEATLLTVLCTRDRRVCTSFGCWYTLDEQEVWFPRQQNPFRNFNLSQWIHEYTNTVHELSKNVSRLPRREEWCYCTAVFWWQTDSDRFCTLFAPSLLPLDFQGVW